ncbi:unnamed protein product [Brassica rapa subsp. trilocularis]
MLPQPTPQCLSRLHQVLLFFMLYICVGWRNLTHCHNNQLHFGDDSSIIEDDCAMISPTVIKFELQVTTNSHTMRTSREEKYLLDIQRVNGPQFLFLDLCAAFLTELRVI